MSERSIARPGEAADSASVLGRAVAAAIAALLGAFIVLGVGFVHIEALHNAAHDTRHSFSFPCH